MPTCSTTISDRIGHLATPQRHISNQTQPAPFWRAFACALAGCTAKVRARQAAFDEVCRPLPYPQSARLLPRLACALNQPLFVHFAQPVKAPPALVLRGENYVSKIVQICALLCFKKLYASPSCISLRAESSISATSGSQLQISLYRSLKIDGSLNMAVSSYKNGRVTLHTLWFFDLNLPKKTLTNSMFLFANSSIADISNIPDFFRAYVALSKQLSS